MIFVSELVAAQIQKAPLDRYSQRIGSVGSGKWERIPVNDTAYFMARPGEGIWYLGSSGTASRKYVRSGWGITMTKEENDSYTYQFSQWKRDMCDGQCIVKKSDGDYRVILYRLDSPSHSHSRPATTSEKTLIDSQIRRIDILKALYRGK